MSKLKAFSKIGLVKYTGQKGVVERIKWINHVVCVLDMMVSVSIESSKGVA